MESIFTKPENSGRGARPGAWALLLFAVGGASCSDPAAPPIDRCTQQFNLFMVTVLDMAGEPAEGVVISVRGTSNVDGRPFDSQSPIDLTEVNDFVLPTPGLYVIVTDRNLEMLAENGTVVEVVGTLGEAGFTAEYVFDRDACHVSKVSGPETVQLEPLSLGSGPPVAVSSHPKRPILTPETRPVPKQVQ